MAETPKATPEARTSGQDWQARRPAGRPAVLSGWGRYPLAEAEEARPASLSEVTPWVRGPHLARGLGRSYGDAALPAPGGLSLSALDLDHLLSFDPRTGVLEAEAGVTLERILKVFLPKGWFLPVTPGTSQVTLGGALASNVHGKNHHRDGSIENFVEEVEVQAPSGAFRCSPETRPDLFRATVGGYGLTGLITRVRLRLKPVRSPRVVCMRRRSRDLSGVFRLFEETGEGWEYSVAWLDTLARGRSLGRGILMLGNHEVPQEGAWEETSLSRVSEGLRLAVPVPLPSALMHPLLLQAFNAAFHRFSRAGGPHPEHYAHFFYPLDRIKDWNLLYGKPGFLQYQFAIPDPGEEGVTACLDFLVRSRVGAFLSVLKRCGDDHALLPFCRRGFTLALDIPYRGAGTLKVLDRLDEIVIRHRGRVYLTKDARLSRDAFRAMYPEWKAFMAAVRQANPEAVCSSRMAERLGLWEP